MRTNNIALALCLALAVTGCSKETDSTPAAGNGPGAGTFTWVEGNGGQGTAIVCDSAYASAQYKTIFVHKGSGTNKYFFEINLSALTPGNYSPGTAPNAVTYQRPGSSTYLVGTAGGITISANSNNELSGTGVVTMPAPVNERVYITMNKVPIR